MKPEKRSFNDLAKEIGYWAKANFGNTPIQYLNIVGVNTPFKVELDWMAPLLGIGEEIGELSKQVLPDMVSWKDADEVKDALADIGIYLADYLCRSEMVLHFCLDEKPEDKHVVVMLSESYGELLHCELKLAQGIRGMDDPDNFIPARLKACLKIHNALQKGVSMFTEFDSIEQLVGKVFDEKVSKRDWKKDKESGGE